MMGIINPKAPCLLILRRRRPQRHWTRLRWKLPCRCARRTATHYPPPGTLGPSSRTTPPTLLPGPRGSHILFTEACRGRQKRWKSSAAPRRSSPLCAAVKITACRRSPRDSAASLPTPKPPARRQLWSRATLARLGCLRRRQTWGILCSRKAKCRWTSARNAEAKSGRS